MAHYDLQVPGAHIMPAVKKCKECGEWHKSYGSQYINYGGRGLHVEDLCETCTNKKVYEGQAREKELRAKLRNVHVAERERIKQIVDDQYTNQNPQKNNEFNEF